MATYPTTAVRNIALTGHGGSGKTTLIETLMHHAGAIKTPGQVERGTTVCDYDALEKRYHHSLKPAIAGFSFPDTHINLLDTPGYPDFSGRALAVLPAVETVAVVVNARIGIELVTQRMFHWAGERGLDRLIIVNQIDAENVDLAACLQQIRDCFGKECLPLNLPADRGQRVIDCFFEPEGDPTDFSSVAEAHTALVDQVIEVDEELMSLYLEQGEAIKPEQLHDPFEQALREGHLIPVCFVSARTGAGIDELLQVFARLMPHPGEGNPPLFLRGEGKEAKPVQVEPKPDKHALAHVFKITIDPFIGKLAVFRIHQGMIGKDSLLFIGDARKPFRVSHLYTLFGKELIEIERGIPGDICAVAKIEDLHFDAVLHDSHDEDHYHLKSVNLPEPMFGLAIQAKTRGDEQKLSDALHKFTAEDPSLKVEHNSALNETVIRGYGDLHLRVMIEAMKERFNLDVDTAPPRIPYRETVTSPAEGHCRHKKQTGGAGQFGEVFLRIRPLERGAGYQFVDAVVGGAIPRQFLPAVEKGILQAWQEGVIGGFLLQDMEVTVYDGKHHPVDSKEIAFVSAGKKAFIEAVRKANPVILEPMVNISITTQGNCVGDITADLSGKRGRINNTNTLPDGSVLITGQVPLSELGNYQSQLRSLTAGAGSYTIEFSHYDPVPPKVQQQLAAQYRPVNGEE